MARMMNQIPMRAPTNLADVLRLLHLFNGVGSGIGVAIGYVISAWHHQLVFDYRAMLLATLATVLVSNGGFIINDILDIEIDRVNRPDRPLPAGKVSVSTAWSLYVLSTLLGVGLGLAVNPACGVVAGLIGLLLYLYSAALKKRYVLGHVAIAVMGAALFPYGGLVAGHLLPVLYSVLFTFPAFIAREVLKTVPDYEGDRANNIDNLATRHGPQFALRFGQVALAITALALPLVTFVWPLNRWYIAAVLVIVWPFTFYTLARATVANVKNLIRFSKYLFLLVAVLLLIGSAPGL